MQPHKQYNSSVIRGSAVAACIHPQVRENWQYGLLLVAFFLLL